MPRLTPPNPHRRPRSIWHWAVPLVLAGALLHAPRVFAQESGGSSAKATTPTATPTPSPSPTPIRFIPPLSLPECQALIARAEAMIPRKEEDRRDAVWVSGIQSMVDTSANYLNFRSDLHTSLSHYRWVELGGGRVENTPNKTDRDEKIFDPPIEEISALSLEARNGDVFVHRISVFDEKDNKRQEFDFSTRPRILHHALPRRDVFHLWRRTTVSRIEIEYSQVFESSADQQRPRVTLFGGITTSSRPEFVKTAIWHLQEAKAAITKEDWPTASQSLRDANERLTDYVRRNKPR